MLVMVVSRRTMSVGMVVVAVLEVACPLVLLVIIVILLVILPARSATKWGILSFAASIGWMSPYQDKTRSVALAATSSYKIDPNWYSDTGTTDHITRTWIVSLCVNAIMEVNKFKSAMKQVCKFCIQVILQLILLLVLLHCVNPKEILLL